MVTTPVTITAIRFLNTREAAVQTAAAIRPGLPPDMIWGAIMEPDPAEGLKSGWKYKTRRFLSDRLPLPCREW